MYLHPLPLEFSSYSPCFELFIKLITYLHFIKVFVFFFFFLRFYLVLIFGTYSSISPFSLTFCVGIYALDEITISPHL